MTEISILNSLSFPEPNHVEGRSSIADLYSSDHRCGIYVLNFSNGEWYCGQAVDVTRRFVQHTKNHPDIVEIRFRETPREDLNQVERDCIHQMEASKFRMRNITFMSVIEGETDFDLVMPLEAQNKWLEDLIQPDTQECQRVIDDDLRRRYSRSYKKFSKLSDADQVIQALRSYVQATIPVLRQSEMSFWSVSCLPSYKKREVMIYSRININWQEVMNIHQDPEGIGISIYLAKSYLYQKYGSGLSMLNLRVGGLEQTDSQYTPGGQDQLNLYVRGLGRFQRLIKQPHVIKACRLLNLRLMRKGACNFSRYHCLDLADHLIEQIAEN